MKRMIIFPMICSVIIASAPTKPVKPWVGTWDYSECWPSLNGEVQNCVEYTLRIKPKGNGLSFDLDVDGYQVLRRIHGECKIAGTGIQLVFSSVREGDEGVAYHKGDVLIEFVVVDGKTLTTWKEMKPVLDEHLTPGNYFQKAGQKK